MRKLVPNRCPDNSPSAHEPLREYPFTEIHSLLTAAMAIFTGLLCVESPTRWFSLAAKTPEVINAYFTSHGKLFEIPKDPKTRLSDYQLVRHSVDIRSLEGTARQLRFEAVWQGVARVEHSMGLGPDILRLLRSSGTGSVSAWRAKRSSSRSVMPVGLRTCPLHPSSKDHSALGKLPGKLPEIKKWRS